MPTCPRCGATVPEGAVYCGNCGAALSSPTTSMSATTQPQTSSQTSTAWPKEVSSGDMQARYEKAMRRAELLGYAAAGLGVVILVVVVVLSLLP
jgi:uncharacterized membrane protein YvbJ